MKKKIIAIAILCFMILNAIVIPASAAVANPYGTTAVGCITSIQMKSSTTLRNDVNYFTATVSSKVSGTGKTLSYETYGAVGGEETRMFVYSMGNSSDTDFATKTVSTLMKQFAAENPDWIPLVAINGDFFDIETSSTQGIGEPENVMIQNGDILKGHTTNAAGASIIGMKEDGSVIYHINGFTRTFSYTKNRYNLTVMNSAKDTVLGEHARIAVDYPNATTVTFITPNSTAADLTGMTVYVVNCDTYRYAYRGGSGKVDPEGDYTYYFDGTVESVRAGAANEKPASGKVYIAVPSGVSTTLAVGNFVKANAAVSGNWADVVNAVGAKQAILVNGDSEFTKGMTSSSAATSQVSDTSYSYCWKHRSAIGFKPDGTPVMLVIKKATDDLGATYYEMAEQLKALGCTYGFALDGGGSSTMVIRNNDGTYTTVFAGENGNTGRSVGNAIILAVPKNSGTHPDPYPSTSTTPDTTPTHTCESKCSTCNKCLDTACTESACAAKCQGHSSVTPPDPTLNTLVPIEQGNGYIGHAINDYLVNGESKGTDSRSFSLSTEGSIGITGFAGFSQSIANSGYYFDSDTENIYWNSNFLSAADEAATTAAGSKAMCFNIAANVNAVAAGDHTVSFLIKLKDGTFVIIDTLSFTSTEPEDDTPAPTPDTTPDSKPDANPPTTVDRSNGCGSMIGLPAILTIAVCGGAFICTRRKRK